MKFGKQLLPFLTLFLVVCTAEVRAEATAAEVLSPALETIAHHTGMVKSGLVCTDVCFDREDFQRAVGAEVNSVVITALPPQTSGTLMVGNAPAAVNQSVSAKNLSLIRFVPTENCAGASFRFKAGGEYSMECAIRMLTSVNFAPKADPGVMETGLWTQQDISVYGSLGATDPEGDRVVFEIMDYPEFGLLTLTNPAAGDYKYTPYDGYVGEDAFTYTVRDEYGNYGEEITVGVRVEEPASELVFADMTEHWAHNAALVMVSANVMEVSGKGGEVYFRPEEHISREDFLVTVMKALGAGEIPVTETAFADNEAITEKNRGYIERAHALGVIHGVEEDGRLYFKPEKEITRAEAAVILNAIIGADTPDSVPVFSDNDAVPAWARSSLYALHDAGIFRGTGSGYLSPSSYLSRAQTAQILLTVKKLYED